MTSIAISAGHSLYCRGASSDLMDEVDEARRVTKQLEKELKSRGVDVKIYWDDVSRTQNENLNRIVDWHNLQAFDGEPHTLDVSVHFNAFEQTSSPRGCEVYYITQKSLAAKVSDAIADCGFIDRGAKYDDDLFVLRNTIAPALLLEVCFVDSTADSEIYFANFDLICERIADVLGGEEGIAPEPAPPEALFSTTGRCSFFGGPDDMGMSPSEGLAFHYDITAENQHLFLPLQPAGTTGLARRLNSVAVNYCAARWDYQVTPKEMLASVENVALVRAAKTGLSAKAWPADWGPAGPESDHDTGRVADLSPCLMDALGIATDDEVTVTYPWKEQPKPSAS
jgi:N-acetylmuramoyl-L-alanine amidase